MPSSSVGLSCDVCGAPATEVSIFGTPMCAPCERRTCDREYGAAHAALEVLGGALSAALSGNVRLSDVERLMAAVVDQGRSALIDEADVSSLVIDPDDESPEPGTLTYFWRRQRRERDAREGSR